MFEEYNLVEMKLNDNEDLGVAKMSFVDTPAVGILFVAMAKEDEVQQILIKATDDEKRIVTGVAMVPDEPFLRKGVNGNPPYRAFFSADTIEKTSQKYLSDLNLKNVNTEHSTDVEDVVLCESWIVADTENDKTVSLGLSAPVGAWVTSYKVNNDDLWEDVKSGKYKGLSIEGVFEGTTVSLSEEKVESKEVNLNLEDMNKEEKPKEEVSVLGKVRDFINSLDNTINNVAVEAAAVVDPKETEQVEIKAEKIAQVDYWWQDVVDGTTFALNTQVMKKPYDDDGEPYPLNAGEYETEGGKKVLVDSEGYIRFIFGDAPEEEKEEAAAAEETTEEVVVEASAEVVEIKKEEVAMIAHTDATNRRPFKKLKFDPNMSTKDRIKAGIRNSGLN